ncbi:CDP-glucose 4,6-dehydratase [Paradevosia shaoguanensis]|uniref:CDP-glucose 4,6-dehydratase n=1 Tax=Paradevosia shaoguanensis TaxID=1335043 RepID=UPI003C73A598
MSSSAFDYWNGRRAFVTGDMGFKGTWLCSLLSRLGAQSIGFGQDERSPLLYREMSIPGHSHTEGDINDLAAMTRSLTGSGAEVLFHLAAQPLVLTSYADPVGTFEANVMGTVRVLEAARSVSGLKAIVIVTSDKVYRNDELTRGYRESDPLGGADPYSASKAAAEVATRAMVASFFSKSDAPRVATVRAGNVIGGGDWAAHRLLPDAARALSKGLPLVVRNPSSTRPWQHVLDPLVGYLRVAEKLAIHHKQPVEAAWNFGPEATQSLTVGEVAELFVRAWGKNAEWQAATLDGPQAKEAKLLAVDSGLAHRELNWRPRWRSDEAIRRTAAWYRDHAAGEKATDLVARDINELLAG